MSIVTTARKQQGETRPGGSKARRAVVVALSAALLLTTVAVTSERGSASSQAEILLGCVGTMVISNVDCEMGVATAYDDMKPVTTSDLDRSNGIAPWCGGQTDLTMYGCFAEDDVPDRRDVTARIQDRKVRCHQTVPSLHPDGAMRAAKDPCEGDLWIGDVLIRLEENRVMTIRCLEATNPTPACIP